jgi:hypothetical protein
MLVGGGYHLGLNEINLLIYLVAPFIGTVMFRSVQLLLDPVAVSI